MEARMTYFISVLICLMSVSQAALAQQPITPPDTGSAEEESSTPATISFPYVATITGNDVYIRSGPGTNYYPCSMLNKGDKVTVVGSHFSWSRIVPPAGSFSWISMRYVEPDANNPSVGIVTGNAVPVYVGSVYKDPIQSTRSQLALNRGGKVAMLREKQSDYYKIAPPSGDYRWVNAGYTEPIIPTEKPIELPTMPQVNVTEVEVNVAEVNEIAGPNVAAAPTALNKFYALQDKLNAERQKPFEQQDYKDLKAALEAIGGDKQAGKAARYAQFALDQIRRFEVVLEVARADRLQDKRLQQISENIEKARARRLAEIEELGKFQVIGLLQPFATYGRGHYRIVDPSGRKTLCYALPTGPAANMDLSGFLGRKVGLIGKVKPHPQTGGAVVSFERIVELD